MVEGGRRNLLLGPLHEGLEGTGRLPRGSRQLPGPYPVTAPGPWGPDMVVTAPRLRRAARDPAATQGGLGKC